MNRSRPRPRPEACFSDYAFDRRLSGETRGEDVASFDAHVAECARCAERLGEIRTARASFSRQAPAWEPSVRSGPPVEAARGGGRRLGMIAGGLALAAAAALWIRGEPLATSTRPKGAGFALGVYINHAGSVRAGREVDERVGPGDALRFVYTVAEPRHLAVLSLDGAKHANVYYPAGEIAARVERGSRVALPASTVLDDVLGPETIYGIACPDPFALEPLRRELEASSQVTPPAGCDLETLSLRKVAGSP
jgi:hypothetical protein